MSRAIVFFFLLLGIGCTSDDLQSNKTIEPDKKVEAKIPDETFDVKLQIAQIDKEYYSVAATIELDSGSYVVSPYSKDGVFGPFTINIEDNGHLISVDSLSEIPRAVEEFDPIINKQVKWIRENTTYKQKVKVVTQDDFEVVGQIWFVLEPICNPYKIEFVISHQAGNLSIRKMNTRIDKGGQTPESNS